MAAKGERKRRIILAQREGYMSSSSVSTPRAVQSSPSASTTTGSERACRPAWSERFPLTLPLPLTTLDVPPQPAPAPPPPLAATLLDAPSGCLPEADGPCRRETRRSFVGGLLPISTERYEESSSAVERSRRGSWAGLEGSEDREEAEGGGGTDLGDGRFLARLLGGRC